MAALTSRTADTTPTGADLVYTAKTPFGATDDKKVLVSNLSKGLDAGLIPNTPAGAIAATDIQAAITELDTEKLATTGQAATVATITGLAPDTATTQATQAAITSAANLVTVGALASGSIAAGFGDIQMGETSIKLDATLSGDGTWSGITTSGVSGVTTLAIGDLIYLNANDSRWELVDANLADGYDKLIGMALTVAADGAALEVLLYGKIRSAVLPAGTVGSAAYMGETAGDIVLAAPTTASAAVRKVGHFLLAEDFMFAPSSTVVVLS